MQGFHDRSTSLLPHLLSVVGGVTADVGLDRIELADARQHLGGKRRFRGDIEVVEGPPHVGPAEGKAYRIASAISGQPLEPGISVDLENAVEPGQVSGGTGALAVLGIHVGCRGVRRAAPGPVIDRVAPKASCLGPAATGIEHRQRRVVGEQLGGRQHRADHQVVERRQPPAGPPDPVAQRRAIQRHALPRQHLRLAIQRQRVAELAHHHMRHQRFGGHAAIDRPLRRRGDHHGPLAGAAGVAGAARDAHPQLRGRDVELLGAQFVDHVQRTAAAWAVMVLDVDHHLIAGQMRRQSAVIAIRSSFAPLPLRVLPRGRRVLCRLVFGDGLLEVLQPELELVRVELLGAAAELVAHQALDQQPQLVVLGMQFRMLLRRRGDDLAQHLLQDGGVVRQGVEIDLHATIMNNAPASVPAL